jgi:hypothetical protein
MRYPGLDLVVVDNPGIGTHPSIGAAINAAQQPPGASVWIPASYTGGESVPANPGVPVFDFRGTSGTFTGSLSVIAKVDLTAQAANIAPTTLYTVPVNAGGMYRISGYVILTQAATTSSTLPNIAVNWTDVDVNAVILGAALNGNPTNNVVGTTSNVGYSAAAAAIPGTINAKGGTVIQWLTQSYASSGATPMLYAVHIKLEYLGQ